MNETEFKAARQELGWSQQRLADELGLSLSAVQRMESGSRPIEKRTILAIQYILATLSQPQP